MPDHGVHLRQIQQLLHLGHAPGDRDSRVPMREMSPALQLRHVQIDGELHVDLRRLEPLPHHLPVHLRVIDVAAKRAPVGAGRAPDEE
eukprot:12978377-Alexandrium_andersonii.AAC.1